MILPLIKVNSEIPVLRGVIGQYNVIRTLPYESVAPMHKSASGGMTIGIIAKHVYDSFQILLKFIEATSSR